MRSRLLYFCLAMAWAFTSGAETHDLMEDGPSTTSLPADASWQEPALNDAIKPAVSTPFVKQALGTIRNAHRRPGGALSNVIVYCSAGHGFTADTSGSQWVTQRGLLNGMVEDMGNIDQLNFFVNYCFNAGATVVPFRPVGYQTNEVVIDNDDAEADFSGTWYNSGASIFYGDVGDTPYRYAYINTNGQTAAARYIPAIPTAGFYPVYCWTRRANDRVEQLYTIRHSGGESALRIDHERVGSGWIWLGTYHFNSGTNGWVEISNYAPGRVPTNDVIIADAIRFGNGMGDTDRGFGVSGYERELECARYWVQNATGQGMPSTLYDLVGYSDQSDNVGAPARMAEYMNDSAYGGYWDRIYLGFHSNAGGGGTGRGPMGLYSTNNSTTVQNQQKDFAQALVDEIFNDMEWGDSETAFLDDWIDNTIDVYGQAYGEISSYNNSEMNSTIIEIAFHDSADDANLMNDPVARDWYARACYQGLVKHLHAYNASNVPLALLPDPPRNACAYNSGSGRITVIWNAPTTNAAGGNAAESYVVYHSTNGYGFGNPIGTTNTFLVMTNLSENETHYFQVSAVNAGGESLPSPTIGVRSAPSGRAYHLVVGGFDRADRYLSPTRYFGNNIGGYVTLVRPRQVNAFDYTVQHGDAIAAAGRFFDSCDHGAITQSVIQLTNYHAVYWYLGEESTRDETFSTAEQQLVESYLRAGGRVFVSGAELGWDLDNLGSADDRSFLTNTLRTAYVRDDADTYQATGKSGSIFDGLSTLVFDDGSCQTYDVTYPDVIAPADGASAALCYGSSSSGSDTAGIVYSNSSQVVVLGFPFETIVDRVARTDLMARVVRFFGDPADYDSDGDGMPDWWEMLYFTNGLAAQAATDEDADGADNFHEWIAGTIPTNSASYFLVTPVESSPSGGAIIRWPSATNRTYSIEWSTNLAGGFNPLAQDLPATPPENCYTDTVHTSEETLFYAVRAVR
jgi:hypothetical protein